VDASSVLIATLGGQPQVVTFALDALLARGETIREVIVVFPSPSDGRLHRSLTRLAAEFPGDGYQGRPCRLRPIPLESSHGRVEDLRSEGDADAAWLTIHKLFGLLKEQGRHIHLCAAGGRRLMGVLALSAAMLHFGHHDRAWHLYTPDALRQQANEGAIMHAAPEDGVRLIQVPLAPWGAYFPGLRALLATSPAQVIAAQRQTITDAAERARCEQVLARLTDRQREVLRAFAQGASPQAVADQLNVTLKTVDSHKTQILGECRVAWSLPEKSRLDYVFLREKFRRYYEQMDTV
jgi:CRISPR-associated protein Csx14